MNFFVVMLPLFGDKDEENILHILAKVYRAVTTREGLRESFSHWAILVALALPGFWSC